MTSNNLTKKQQIEKGLKSTQKGDWCEYMAAAKFRKEGYLTYMKMSGPIDLVLIHEETGEVRYIDVKYKNTRQGTNTRGRRINRSVNSRLGKHLKKFINIEIIYVDDEGKIEKSSSKGRQEWHASHKLLRNEMGQYTGEILKI